MRHRHAGTGKQYLAVLLIASLFVGWVSPATPSFAADTVFTGTVDAAGTNWRTHSFQSDGAVTVTATLDWDTADADLNLGLRDPSGTWVKWASSKTAKPETITWSLDQPGTWSFGVSARAGATAYTLTVATTEPPPEPAPGQEQFTGTVDAAGTSWKTHRIEVTAAGSIHAVLDWDNAAADLNLGLQDPSGTWVQWASSSMAKPEEILWDATVTGTWTVGVKARSGSAAYTLSVGHSGGAPPPPQTEPSPTNEVPPPSDSSLPPTGESFTWNGKVSSTGTSWRTHDHELVGPARLTATIDWDNAAANLDLFLRAPDGKWVASATSTTAKPETLTYVASQTGTWRLGIRATSGSAAYTATLFVEETTPATTPVHVRQIGGPGHAEMYPSGIDVDENGHVYLADTGNDRISSYAADGSLRWRVGSRGHAVGDFVEPRDVAYHDGRVFVADTGSNRIQVLDAGNGSVFGAWGHWFRAIMGVSAGVNGQGNPVILATDGITADVTVHGLDGGVVLTVGAGPGSADGQLNEPRDAATDAAGTIYVADFRNHRIAKFAADGTWLGSFGELGSEPGQFSGPYGVEVDEAGRVYVADSNNGRIQQFDSQGTFLASWGTKGTGDGEFTQLRNVAVGSGPTPDVYAVDLWGYKAVRWAQSGPLERTYGGGAPPPGGFNKPYGVAASPQHVFVADTTNQRIQRFASDGAFQLLWGDRGFAESADGVNWPRDVAMHPERGTVWVADTKNHRIIEYSPSGAATGVQMGRGGTGLGQLQWPHAVATVGGDVIVVDTYNHRVQLWRPPNTVLWTTTGFNFPKDATVHNGVVYVADALNKRIVRLNAADGTYVDQFGHADLNRPEGVAVTPNGAVWVADTSWNRLVQFSSTGRLMQRFGQTGTGHGHFSEPTKLEIVDGTDGRALLHAVDTQNDRVEVFAIDR